VKYIEVLGRKLSAVVFGGDRLSTADVARAAEFLDTYIELGGNFIDTARIYGFGDCEAALGRWLVAGNNREKVFLGTKGGHPEPSSMHTGRLDRQNLEYDICKSLEALRTDHVDMYYLHRDDPSRPVGDIMETLNLFIQSGYTGHIGVSNWSADRIAEAQEYAQMHGLTGLSADQPQFSLARQCAVIDDTLVEMDSRLYEYHKKTKMMCVAYSSQAKGYFMKMEKGETLPELTRRMFDCAENRAIFEKLKEAGVNACSASLSFVIDQPFPSFAIVGSSSIGQLRETMSCADIVLDGFDVKSLRVIS
jgi:aryl-alcohol dehydrogenase-like predicted oxidoreductase